MFGVGEVFKKPGTTGFVVPGFFITENTYY
jgi:hypothetical protein